MTTQQTTTIGLSYGKETLVFGHDYQIGVSTPTGRGDAFFGRLESRAANGDLVFLVGSGDEKRRVRTRTILSVAEDAPLSPEIAEVIDVPGAFLDSEGRPDYDLGEVIASTRESGESARAFVARGEARFPRNWTAFLSTDEGQLLLDEAGREIEASKRVDPKPKTTATRIVLDGTTVAETRHVDATEPTVGEAIVEIAFAAVDAAAKKTSGAKPYAERNQVWKCSECKRRTRQPVCANGHAPVAAPAGKRREDRVAQ